MQAIEFEAEIRDGIIHVPGELRQWSTRSVRVILLEKEPAAESKKSRRLPHPAIAGKGRTIGDLVAPVVDESDWECLK